MNRKEKITMTSVSEMNNKKEEKEEDEEKDPESKDEVDFIPVMNKDANHNNIMLLPTSNKKPLYGDCEMVKTTKTGLTTLEKFSFFTLSRKSSNHKMKTDKPEPRHRKHSFVKSASFSRILGNTYNTKKYENELRKYQDQVKTKQVNFKERFQKSADNNGNATNSEPTTTTVCLADFQETNGSHSHDLGTKAFRTISKGIGKLWFKRSHSVEISTPDPEYKVSYLGNVLTGWAKGKCFLSSLIHFLLFDVDSCSLLKSQGQ